MIHKQKGIGMGIVVRIKPYLLECKAKACIAKSSCVNKRENRARLKVTDTVFCFATFSVVEFLKKYDQLEAGLVSVFMLRSISPGRPLSSSCSQSLGTI